MKAKAGQASRFLRIVTIPIRALGRARDRYVKSMTDYADRVNYSTSTKFVGVSRARGLPKSFSVNPARSYDMSEDFHELVRVASARSLGTRADLDVYMKQQTKTTEGPRSGVRAGMPPRSSSVAMGRIDEDKACSSFGEEINNVLNLKNELKNAPRSKSYVAWRGPAAF